MDQPRDHPKIKKHCGFVSGEQKKEIILFMEEYPELKSGKFTQKFSTKTAQELWMKLRDKLNALPGANKEWKQWRKTWQDMKSKTKKKNTELKNHQMGTGGGPAATKDLDSDEEKIIEIIGPILVEGDPNIQESSCQFSFDEDIEVFKLSECYTEEACTNLPVESLTGCYTKEVSSNVDVESSIQATKCSTGAVTCSVEQSTTEKCSTASKKRTRSRIQRLNQTVEANCKLIELTKEQNKLYKRDVEAKESIAESLKVLVEYLLHKDK